MFNFTIILLIIIIIFILYYSIKEKFLYNQDNLQLAKTNKLYDAEKTHISKQIGHNMVSMVNSSPMRNGGRLSDSNLSKVRSNKSSCFSCETDLESRGLDGRLGQSNKCFSCERSLGFSL
jgi:hypothetical protein